MTNSAKFFAPEKESAVVGYISLQGFSNLPESCLVSPEDFTDSRWRRIYTCGLNLHRSGREANHLTINEELPRLRWDVVLEKEIGPAGWQSWPALCDTSLAYSPRGIAVIECLKDIRRLADERRGHEIVKKAAAGEIGVEETIVALQHISEASRASSLDSILSSRRFDSKNPPELARPIYEINRQSICTPGNITAISARLKHGKSAFVGGCIAASFGLDGDTLGVDSANPHGHALIHFDCEQSPADHHALIVTALSRVGMTHQPEWLRSYRILDVPTAQRFDLLEHELREGKRARGGIHSALLDGVADYVKDPNDPEEAFAAVERLHGLAVQYSTTILCVIHVNPGENGTNKTRGHLGSQLARKAESNIELSKDDDEITTVYTSSSRHAFISKQDGPRFKWDSLAEMHASCGSGRGEKITAAAVRLECIADEVFEDALRYSEAITRIMKAAKVKERQAETLFSDINKAKLIRKNLVGMWELIK
jgi:hypothetical protein